ncbi:hypothetical protein Avbf_14104 [Armadillidium vulgare]|nr:hypothetical protein Avbf_14104 [Armadillidium vulgare]
MDKNIVKSEEEMEVCYENPDTTMKSEKSQECWEVIFDNDEMSPETAKIEILNELMDQLKKIFCDETVEPKFEKICEETDETKTNNEVMEIKKIICDEAIKAKAISEVKDKIKKIFCEEIVEPKFEKLFYEETAETETNSDVMEIKKIICDEAIKAKAISEVKNKIKKIFCEETVEPKFNKMICEETDEATGNIEVMEIKKIICDEAIKAKAISEVKNKIKKIFCEETVEPKLKKRNKTNERYINIFRVERIFYQ